MDRLPGCLQEAQNSPFLKLPEPQVGCSPRLHGGLERPGAKMPSLSHADWARLGLFPSLHPVNISRLNLRCIQGRSAVQALFKSDYAFAHFLGVLISLVLISGVPLGSPRVMVRLVSGSWRHHLGLLCGPS